MKILYLTELFTFYKFTVENLNSLKTLFKSTTLVTTEIHKIHIK